MHQTMEIMQLSSNFVAFLAFISFTIFVIWKKSKSSPDKNKKLPPSPPRLPLISHLHHLAGELPHRGLAKLAKKFGPIMYLKLGEVPFVVITSPEHAKTVLKDLDPACADRPKSIGASIMFYDYQDMGFCSYGDYWKHMRKICMSELLSPINVRSFNYVRQDEALRCVKNVQASAGKVINLSEELFAFSSTVISRAAFGRITKDKGALTKFYKEGFALANGFDLADLFPSFKLLHLFSRNKNRLLSMRSKLDKILERIIQEHKDNFKATGKGNGEFGSEDIVDVLLRLQATGGLEFPITDVNIKAVISDLFGGGSDTSSTTVEWALSELMLNPTIMRKVQNEMRETLKGKEIIDETDVRQLKYLKMVIKETFRLHTPGPLVARACKDECTVDGYTIPRKANVTVNVWAMARDPNYWEEPEVFKPERFENSTVDLLGNDYHFLPFGSGRRMCPGMSFALANVELLLAQLLYHFDWSFPQGMTARDLDMSEIHGLSAARKTPLLLVPACYTPRTD